MASSSYLATKLLECIANTYSKTFPQASKRIFTNFYIDNWLLSTNSVEEIQLLKAQVTMLVNHGLTLRKLMSNNSKVVFDSDYFNYQNNLYTIPINGQLGMKTLGLNWFHLRIFYSAMPIYIYN